MFTARHTSERGQGLVEYALILVLVAVVIIIILGLTGTQVAAKFCDVAIQLGGKAPDSVTACRAPRVTIDGLSGNQTVSGSIAVEAIIKNNKGQVTSGASVQFFIDGVSVRTENLSRYCLGGGDTNCTGTPYDTHGLSNGKHTFRVVATDTSTTPNLTGETSFSFNVAN